MAMKDITDLQVVQAYHDARLQRELVGGGRIDIWPYELLMKWTGQCEKVCYRVMERAADRGLIDYGVTLRSGWLTEKGKALLASAGAADGNISNQT